MPELPEVETTRLALQPCVEGATIEAIQVYQPKLRWPISQSLASLRNRRIHHLHRRSKYLIFELNEGFLLGHFGMTGHLRIYQQKPERQKHDVFDCVLRHHQESLTLRYTDIRRFGFWLYLEEAPWQHALLQNLGPEPLTDAFDKDYLHQITRHKKQVIKSFIMDNQHVVGVGNIYANESLYNAGIHPLRQADTLSYTETDLLCRSIKTVLKNALALGGTTLKDFMNPTGSPGYFKLQLKVYGRASQPCFRCNTRISSQKVAGRQTSFCTFCQPMNA